MKYDYDIDLLKTDNCEKIYNFIIDKYKENNKSNSKNFSLSLKTNRIDLNPLLSKLRDNNISYVFSKYKPDNCDESIFGLRVLFDCKLSDYPDQIKYYLHEHSFFNYIEVRYLFGYLKYNILIKNKIYVIHAPNGFGKSTLLKSIKNMIKSNMLELVKAPLEKITIGIKEKNWYYLTSINNKNDFHYLYARYKEKEMLDEIYIKIDGSEDNSYLIYDHTMFIHNYNNEDFVRLQNACILRLKKDIDFEIKLFNNIMKKFISSEKSIYLDSNYIDTEDGATDFTILKTLAVSGTSPDNGKKYIDENKGEVAVEFLLKDSLKIVNNIKPLIHNKNIVDKGDEIDFELLSSGEKYICYLIAKLIFDSISNQVRTIIIDEPELFLHVEWQQTLIDVINTIKDYLDSKLFYKVNIIITTHSPYIINSPYVEVGGPEYEEN